MPITITHDIDRYYKWKHPKSIIGEALRMIKGISRWGIGEAIHSYSKKNINDPFSNIRELADINKAHGFHTVFYVMTTTDIHDKNINDYRIEDLRDDLEYALSQGAEVGLHVGYNSHNNLQKIKDQKHRLEDVIGQKVTRSRQHYLQYEYPLTFQLLAEAGIENDSSILLKTHEERQKYTSTYEMKDSFGGSLGITQTPLVFMDTHHMHKAEDDIISMVISCAGPAKLQGGDAMVLWHNNHISNHREKTLYQRFLNKLKVDNDKEK